MNKRGMGLLTLLLLLFALGIGTAITMGDVSPEKIEEIKANFSIDDINISMEGTQEELGNALNYYMNGMLNAYEELTKWIMSYTVEHPEIPYQLLFWLLIISIMAPIIIVLFKLLVIIFLLTREYFQSKKEKRLINKYKEEKTNE